MRTCCKEVALAKKRFNYVVLEAEIGDMPRVLLIADKIFEEDGDDFSGYFSDEAVNARVAGKATIETDAEFIPCVLVQLPPAREQRKP